MAQDHDGPMWHTYVAFTTGIIAVLAAIASFQASSYSSLMLREKNNSILFQNKANKEWNRYLAEDITRQVLQKSESISREQVEYQQQALDLEKRSAETTDKFQTYFEKNSRLVTAGTFLEIAIALSSMSILVKKRLVWILSLIPAGIGVYFLIFGLV